MSNDRPRPGGGQGSPSGQDGQQYGEPQYGQPQYGQPQYGQPQQGGYPPPGPPQGYGPQQGGYPPSGPPQKQPKKPIYKRVWFYVAAVVALVVIISVATSGGSKKKDDNQAGGSATSVTTPTGSASKTSSEPSPGVSKGLGAKDASGDVVVNPKPTVDPDLGIPSANITVTNHSSKRSDYIIDLALVSADGKTQIDTTPALVENLEPGQTAKQNVSFLSTDKLPAGSVVKLQTVQRNPSL